MMMIIISISIGKWYMHVLWILWSSWVFYSANQGGPRNMVQGTTRWSCAFWRMLVWMKFHITMMVCKRAKMANWQLFSKLAGQFAHEDWQIGNPKKVNTVSNHTSQIASGYILHATGIAYSWKEQHDKDQKMLMLVADCFCVTFVWQEIFHSRFWQPIWQQ